jgi:hypothetical protein
MGNERHLLEELKEQNATDAGAISNSSFRNEKKLSVSLYCSQAFYQVNVGE